MRRHELYIAMTWSEQKLLNYAQLSSSVNVISLADLSVWCKFPQATRSNTKQHEAAGCSITFLL